MLKGPRDGRVNRGWAEARGGMAARSAHARLPDPDPLPSGCFTCTEKVRKMQAPRPEGAGE